MVLKHLLIQPSTISFSSSALHPLAIFRTCHNLYDEGYPIFYGENTLEFGLDLDPRFYGDGPETMVWKLHAGRSVKLKDLSHDAFCSRVALRFSHVTLRIFLNVLVIESDQARWITVECLEHSLRAMRPYLIDKKVEVTYDPGLRHLINARAEHARSFLMLFELIRCQSLCFTGVGEAISNQVSELATANKPILDLPLQGLKLWQAFKDAKHGQVDGWLSWSDEEFDLGTALGNAARRFYPDDFERVSNEIVARTKVLKAQVLAQEEYGTHED